MGRNIKRKEMKVKSLGLRPKVSGISISKRSIVKQKISFEKSSNKKTFLDQEIENYVTSISKEREKLFKLNLPCYICDKCGTINTMHIKLLQIQPPQ